MESEIIALSTSGALPIPVHGPRGESPPSTPLLGGSPSGLSPRVSGIAPYQALPVTAQAITEHLTAALPIIEHQNLSQEVKSRL